MHTNQKRLITRANLAEATNKTVLIPAVAGCHVGRGFRAFPLKNFVSTALGNDAFTEVYFTTRTGNLYRIGRKMSDDASPMDCILTDVNSFEGQPINSGYLFTEEELRHGILTVGNTFLFNLGYTHSSAVTAILAVNMNRCCAEAAFDTDLESNIPTEFLRFVGWK